MSVFDGSAAPDEPGRDDRYVVTIARYGTRSTMRDEVYLNYRLYGQDDGPIDMDYFFWVVRNDQRTIVVDTGFSRAGGSARGRTTLLEPTEFFRRLGVDAGAAPPVVLTHAHYDHMGNLTSFPTSTIHMSAREYRFWTSADSQHVLFQHSVDAAEMGELVRAAEEGRISFYEGRHTLAPGVELIEVGGHTPGQTVVKVATEDGVVLLASDAIHYYEEYELNMPFMSVADIVGMYQGFDLIRDMVRSGEVQHVVSGHDPSTLGRFTPMDGELAGLAATIGARA